MSENDSSGIPLKNVAAVFGFIIALGLVYWSWNANMVQAPLKLDYYCLSCKKTESIEEFRKDFPSNWKQYPGGGSDSVLFCLKCKKGRAHPVLDCQKCGAVFIQHLFPKYDEYGDHSCPKCDAKYGQLAKSRGIDLMPKELNP